MDFFKNINRQLSSLTQKVTEPVTRLAGQNPVVRAILSNYGKLPAPVRSYLTPRLNPLGGVWSPVVPSLISKNPETQTALTLGYVANPITGAIAAVSQLGGSTPQSDDPFESWQRLGYKSRNDMEARVERQAQREFAERFGIVYGGAKDPLLSDYGPPTPWVNIPGSVAYENFMASQNQKVNAPLPGPRVDASTTQAIQLGAAAPRQSAPVIPVTPTAPPAPVVSQAAYNAAIQGFQAPTDMPLSEFYAAQENIGRYAEQGGELQRRLKEAGAGAGMSDEALMTWAQKNPALAYRELVRREKKGGISVD